MNLGSSNRGNQNNEERVGLEGINLIQLKKEEEKTILTSLKNSLEEEEEENESNIDNNSESVEIPFGEEASTDKEEAREEEYKSEDDMSP